MSSLAAPMHARARRVRSIVLATVVALGGMLASAVATADIYGWIDEQGKAHFASEKIDERYTLFFRGGESFDTAQGLGTLGPGGRALAAEGRTTPAASQALLALFEASPGYRPTRAALQDAARRHAIDYELLQALVATESGFDVRAVSPKGALGLMQVMPDTAARYGLRADKSGSIERKLFDARTNIQAGSRYLRDLITMFPGQLELALAAYNAGEGAVLRAGRRIPAYRETQNYVRTVLQLYAYLKPSAGAAPGRVRMELVPRGGAIGRGNLPAGVSPGTPGTASGAVSGAVSDALPRP